MNQGRIRLPMAKWVLLPPKYQPHLTLLSFFESDFSKCFYIPYLSTKELFLESQRFSLNTDWLPRKVVIDEPLRSPPMAFACSASHPRPWGSSLHSIVFLWNHITKVWNFTANIENLFIFSSVLGFNFPYNVIYEKMEPKSSVKITAYGSFIGKTIHRLLWFYGPSVTEDCWLQSSHILFYLPGHLQNKDEYHLRSRQYLWESKTLFLP